MTTLALMLGGFGCSKLPSEPEFDNPIIPDDPSFVPPKVTLVSCPSEGAVLNTCHVELVWRGNQPDMEFTYQLDIGEWSAWADDTTLTCPWLDEGTHDFQVKGRYASGIETDSAAAVSFVVNDIQGPALWLSPRHQEIDQDSTFTVEVMLEEVENIFALKAVLEFDPTKLQVSQIEVYEDTRSLLKANGGTVIPFDRYDNSTGTATIEVATATGNPPGVSGTGAIAQLTFTAIGGGNSQISNTTASILRDPDNQSITINELVDAAVEVR
ncbi:MAG: hypothetical protein JSU77_01975 [Fidelibacterota bacterium]|nr:MAG: hypothetical protein JSU77_01975 [Candidatus Neomarinimicrobiota bacterium]